MKKTIDLNNKQVVYTYRRLRRARSVTVTVKPDATLLVTFPYFVALYQVEKFLQKNSLWISKKLSEFEARKNLTLNFLTQQDYLKYRQVAKKYIMELVEKMNSFYNFEYKKINIRSQSTLWGSCSSKGNLSFNYKLYFLPQPLAEYIIAHELCHLAELNHSKSFWTLVNKAVPDYKNRIKELKKRY